MVAGALLLSGCSVPEDPVPTPTESSVTLAPDPSGSAPSVTLVVTGAETSHLIGRWIPVDFTGMTTPDLEFRAGGTWRASDGCNETEGTWADTGSGVEVTAGPSTLIGCAGVPTAGLLQQAAGIEFTPEGHMFLVGVSGTILLELVEVDAAS